MSKIRDSLRRAQDEGWTAVRTSGGHLKLVHPEASVAVFTSAETTDWRAERNLQAQLRRALASSEAKDGGEAIA